MPEEPNTEERLTELERILKRAQKEHSVLSDAILVLNASQRGLEETTTAHKAWLEELTLAQARTEERWRETDERWRETDERFREMRDWMQESRRESNEYMRRVDSRFDALVSAMGEYIRRQP